MRYTDGMRRFFFLLLTSFVLPSAWAADSGLNYVPVPFAKGHMAADTELLRAPEAGADSFGAVLDSGTDVEVLDAAETGRPTRLWLQVQSGEDIGWVPREAVEPLRLGLVTANVRLRLDPAVDADVRGTIRSGTQVEILEKSPKAETLAGKTAFWYRVVTDANVQGWVFGAYLKELSTTELK